MCRAGPGLILATQFGPGPANRGKISSPLGGGRVAGPAARVVGPAARVVGPAARHINGQSRRKFPGRKTGIPDGSAILKSRTGILRVPVTIKRDYREF